MRFFILLSLSFLLLGCPDKDKNVDYVTCKVSKDGKKVYCPRNELKGDPGKDGKDGESCSLEQVTNGVLVKCPTGNAVVYNGIDGRDGTDSVLEIIDPCGNQENQFDEIILRLSDGSLLCYFQSGDQRFLSLIGPGNYITTDNQSCYFTVNEDLTVEW